jgi:hypothetical protein
VANSAEEAYFDWLKSQTAITTLADVYWQEAPSGTGTPIIVMWVVDDPNLKQHLGVSEQGAARIQHHIWCKNIGLSARIRALLRRTVDAIKATQDGYTMYCESVSEHPIPRQDNTEPYHMVVDAVIRWRNG